jgi:hypothetical protein
MTLPIMQFRGIIAHYIQNLMKHIITLRGQSAEVYNIKVGSIYTLWTI